MRTQYPMIMRVVQTMYASNMVLRKQRQAIENALHEGQVTETDAAKLKHEVNKRIKELYLAPLSSFGVSEQALPQPHLTACNGIVERHRGTASCNGIVSRHRVTACSGT